MGVRGPTARLEPSCGRWKDTRRPRNRSVASTSTFTFGLAEVGRAPAETVTRMGASHEGSDGSAASAPPVAAMQLLRLAIMQQGTTSKAITRAPPALANLYASA